MANLVAGYNTAGAGSSTVWTSPGNVTAEDGVFTVSPAPPAGTPGSLLKTTQYGFSIPSNATIVGFRIRIKGKLTLGLDIENNTQVGLTKDGSSLAGTADGSFGFSGTNTAYERPDGVTETWLGSTTWTPAEVNATTFGVLVWGINAGAATNSQQVDVVQVKVFYTVNSTASAKLWGRSPDINVRVY